MQLATLVGAEVGRGTRRIDPGAPQRFIDEEVAETCDARLIHQHRFDRCRTRAECAIELSRGDRERVRPETRFVGVELDGAQPPGVAQHERTSVGEVHAEAMPFRNAPIARIDQRIAGLVAIDEHATAHSEVRTEPSIGICGIEQDLLSGASRRREPIPDERVPERRRGRAPLEEPRVGCVYPSDLPMQGALAEQLPRRLDLQDLRHVRSL